MQQNIYDNETFVDEYDRMRNEEKGTNANDVIEIPIFRKMMPDVSGKRILDLGCGYGENDRYYREKGASYVLGTDISSHMIEIANRDNKIDGVEYEILAMEDIDRIDKKFDIVMSSLAFHYVEDFDGLIKNINRLLTENGVLLFSQEHPVTTCLIRDHLEKNKIEINGRLYRLVADYNRCGPRNTPWNNVQVLKYYRNMATIFNTLIKNGFVIDEINECEPNEEMVSKNSKYANQYDAPYFLFVKSHKIR